MIMNVAYKKIVIGRKKNINVFLYKMILLQLQNSILQETLVSV